MESSGLVPTPRDDGVAGTQQAGMVVELVESATPPLQGQYLQNTLIGLVSTRPAKFGGEFSAPLIMAMINQISHEKDQAKEDVTAKQVQLDNITTELNTLKIEHTKLQERVSFLQKTGYIKQFCSFISPVLFSVAIDLYKGNFNISIIVGGIAGLLLLVNFLEIKGKQS